MRGINIAFNDVKRIFETAENIGEFEIAEKYKETHVKIKERLIETKKTGIQINI